MSAASAPATAAVPLRVFTATEEADAHLDAGFTGTGADPAKVAALLASKEHCNAITRRVLANLEDGKLAKDPSLAEEYIKELKALDDAAKAKILPKDALAPFRGRGHQSRGAGYGAQ